MIKKETLLKIADNSGGKYCLCIQVSPYAPRKGAVLGTIITVVIKTCKTHKSVKKHEIYKAIVIRTSSWISRKSIGNFKFDNNSVILLDLKGNPKGKRIYGPVLENLKKYKKFSKIISLSKIIL